MKLTGGDIIRCPECGGPDIRRSLPRGPIDAIFLRLGKKPLRCRACSYRFYRAIGETKPEEDPGESRTGAAAL
jgi:DNA-directed RNA polymerase subunit RPC12/RpoP